MVKRYADITGAALNPSSYLAIAKSTGAFDASAHKVPVKALSPAAASAAPAAASAPVERSSSGVSSPHPKSQVNVLFQTNLARFAVGTLPVYRSESIAVRALRFVSRVLCTSV